MTKKGTLYHTCEVCGSKMRLDERFFGRRLSCRQCGKEFVAMPPVPGRRSGGHATDDPFGMVLLLPWLGGVVAVLLWVWSLPGGVAWSGLGLVVAAAVVASAALTMVDAMRVARKTGIEIGGWSAASWAVGVVLVAPVLSPLYALRRSKAPGLRNLGIPVALAVVVFAGLVVLTLAPSQRAVNAGIVPDRSGVAFDAAADRRRYEQTVDILLEIGAACQAYQVDRRRYPDADEVVQLALRLEPDFIEAVAYVDAWGNRIHVRSTDEQCELRSFGGDNLRDVGEPRGAVTEDDADVVWISGELVQWPYGLELEAPPQPTRAAEPAPGSDPSPVTASGLVFTREMFDAVGVGMAYADVTGIMGADGTEMGRTSVEGRVTVIFSWINSDGSSITVLFEEERAIRKSQKGL